MRTFHPSFHLPHSIHSSIHSPSKTLSIFHVSSVFRATNFAEHRVAACKVIALTEKTSDKERKNVEKEMRVHSALKHENVLEFLNAVVVELKHKHVYHPGIYILLELAAGGDLFDKIGACLSISLSGGVGWFG